LDGCCLTFRIWTTARSIYARKNFCTSINKGNLRFLTSSRCNRLNDLFRRLESGENVQDEIDNFETHIVPIIADIDAGFGNEATYLLTKKMIEALARAIQVENQVSDAKQCGHQDGKVTVPHEDFLLKLMLSVMPFRIRCR
jgi:isocitrate lyase